MSAWLRHDATTVCWLIDASAGIVSCTENVPDGPSVNEVLPSQSKSTRSSPQANPVPDAITCEPGVPCGLSSFRAGAATTLNGAVMPVRPHQAVTVCFSEGEASAGTTKVTVEPSPPVVEVCSGCSSHCHDIVCETLDPPPRQASTPFGVAVTRVCPGVPCGGDSVRPGCSVTVNVAESLAFPGPEHDAVTS